MTLTTMAIAGALAVTVVPSPAAPEYTVVDGDSVSAIADRFGLTTDDVLTLNGLERSSLIFPGQVLRLLPADSPPPTPEAAPAPPPVPAAPAPAAAAHVVVSGDTVSAIASSAGVGVQALLDANGLTWASIIYPGQQLVFPATTASAAPAPAPAPVPAPVVPVADSQPLAAVDPAAVIPLTDEMRANAATIIRIGRSLGVSDQGLVIALAAAAQESRLRNVEYGDADSLGLFQQRPSTGWGTPEQVMDPVRATDAFFGGPANPNGTLTRGLLDIPGWESMTVTQAAQAVQISAHPDAYAAWETSARQWLSDLG